MNNFSKFVVFVVVLVLLSMSAGFAAEDDSTSLQESPEFTGGDRIQQSQHFVTLDPFSLISGIKMLTYEYMIIPYFSANLSFDVWPSLIYSGDFASNDNGTAYGLGGGLGLRFYPTVLINRKRITGKHLYIGISSNLLAISVGGRTERDTRLGHVMLGEIGLKTVSDDAFHTDLALQIGYISHQYFEAREIATDTNKFGVVGTQYNYHIGGLYFGFQFGIIGINF